MNNLNRTYLQYVSGKPSPQAFYGPYIGTKALAIATIKDEIEFETGSTTIPLGLKFAVRATNTSKVEEYLFVGYLDTPATSEFNATNCVLVGSGSSTTTSETYPKNEGTDIKTITIDGSASKIASVSGNILTLSGVTINTKTLAEFNALPAVSAGEIYFITD